MTEAGDLRRRLVSRLVEQGFGTGRWADAIAAVPRHLFLPDTVWRHHPGRRGNDLMPVHRAEHPDKWLALAYADQAVIVQVDDGRPAADGTGHEASSSLSHPAIVAEMLAELDPRPGDRVLEIGTGTGWNAALLATLAGADNVTSVEVDPALAHRARVALCEVGLDRVTVVTADGLAGWAPGAPYDRLIATVGVVERVPAAWLDQVAPGGRIVAPLTNSYRSPGIAVLTRQPDRTATGRLAGPAEFMAVREHRGAGRPHGRDTDQPVEHSDTTDVHPWHWVGDRNAAVAIGQRAPGVHHVWQADGADTGTQCLLDPSTRSWATVTVTDEPPYLVAQAGPRRLFDEVISAYRWWQDQGEPAVAAWSVQVGPQSERPELVLGPPRCAARSARSPRRDRVLAVRAQRHPQVRETLAVPAENDRRRTDSLSGFARWAGVAG